MELILKRIAKRKGYTIGKLYVESPKTQQTNPLQTHPQQTHPLTPPVREGSGLRDEQPLAVVEQPLAVVSLPSSRDEAPLAVVPLPSPRDEAPLAAVPLPSPRNEAPLAAVPLRFSRDKAPLAAVPLPSPRDEAPLAVVPLPYGRVEDTPVALPPLPPHQDREEQNRCLVCDTLEPAALELKTTVDKATVLRSPKKTAALKPFAIPEGRYAVVVTWSPKFKQWLPLLLGGPEFNQRWKGIRIHAGNTAKDTEGCILVGENRVKGQVLNSRANLQRLMKLLAQRPEGEAVHLTIE